MKHTIQNISRRPLTIICNSGKAIHMTPDYRCEISEGDLKNNPMVKKMLARKLLNQVQVKATAKSEAKSGSAGSSSHAASTEAGKKKSSDKK